jgi:hypothetical protein
MPVAMLILVGMHCQQSFIFLLHTVVGDGPMNKFGSCIQWRSELFKPRMLFFAVGKGTMNTPRYWELRDACSDVNTSANTPRLSYPYIAMNFNSRGSL